MVEPRPHRSGDREQDAPPPSQTATRRHGRLTKPRKRHGGTRPRETGGPTGGRRVHRAGDATREHVSRGRLEDPKRRESGVSSSGKWVVEPPLDTCKHPCAGRRTRGTGEGSPLPRAGGRRRVLWQHGTEHPPARHAGRAGRKRCGSVEPSYGMGPSFWDYEGARKPGFAVSPPLRQQKKDAAIPGLFRPSLTAAADTLLA